MLRVKDRSECPEDNLRDLMWDSNPNCGIAREREKKRRETENFPTKSSNLRHSLARSQNKGMSEYQRRAIQVCTDPSTQLEAERQVCHSQSQKARGNLSPRDRIFHQSVSRFPVASGILDG